MAKNNPPIAAEQIVVATGLKSPEKVLSVLNEALNYLDPWGSQTPLSRYAKKILPKVRNIFERANSELEIFDIPASFDVYDSLSPKDMLKELEAIAPEDLANADIDGKIIATIQHFPNQITPVLIEKIQKDLEGEYFLDLNLYAVIAEYAPEALNKRILLRGAQDEAEVNGNYSNEERNEILTKIYASLCKFEGNDVGLVRNAIAEMANILDTSLEKMDELTAAKEARAMQTVGSLAKLFDIGPSAAAKFLFGKKLPKELDMTPCKTGPLPNAGPAPAL